MPSRIDYEYPTVPTIPSRKNSAILIPSAVHVTIAAAPSNGHSNGATQTPSSSREGRETLFEKFVQAHDDLASFKYVTSLFDDSLDSPSRLGLASL